MKIEYNNLYTHFIFSTLHRLPVIEEKHRQRIEKYITGIVHPGCLILPPVKNCSLLKTFNKNKVMRLEGKEE